MGRPVVDSNIIIDHLLGHPAATAELTGRGALSISIVTWIEVMSGGPPEDEALIREVLAQYEVLPLTQAGAEDAASLRRLRRLKLPDAVIWATARTAGSLLITRNTKDFPASDPGIRVPYGL